MLSATKLASISGFLISFMSRATLTEEILDKSLLSFSISAPFFPIMIPGIIVTAAYSFLLMWSEYLFALAFLTKTNLKTMPLELYAFFGEHTTQWGQVMAASALTTIPTLLLFLPLQKFISEGLTTGSVKN